LEQCGFGGGVPGAAEVRVGVLGDVCSVCRSRSHYSTVLYKTRYWVLFDWVIIPSARAGAVGRIYPIYAVRGGRKKNTKKSHGAVTAHTGTGTRSQRFMVQRFSPQGTRYAVAPRVRSAHVSPRPPRPALRARACPVRAPAARAGVGRPLYALRWIRWGFCGVRRMPIVAGCSLTEWRPSVLHLRCLLQLLRWAPRA
jgi:hypothetical protein